LIQEGKCVDKNGAQINVGPGTQYYGYIVCTKAAKIEALRKHYSFIPMPDGLGYFRWHDEYRIYTELLDYDKVIGDAKKRNQVLFEKLHLPLP
jgi:hypothetical protein